MLVDSRLMRAHLEELARRVAPAYRLFEPIERGSLPEAAATELRRATARIVEAALAAGVSVDDLAQDGARWVVQLGMPASLQAMKAWGDLVVATKPSRKGLRAALSGFRAWLSPVPAESLPAILDVLPSVGPCLGELGAVAASRLMEDIRSLGEDPDALRLIGSFGGTTGRILVSAAQLARQAAQAGSSELLGRLAAACPAEQAVESSDGEALLPDLARFGAICLARGPGCWSAGIGLAVAIAEKNVSSAVGALRGLRRRVAAAPAPELYLGAFTRLIVFGGLSAVGFGLSELPRIVSRLGEASTAELVDTAVAVADAYGPTAAKWLVEGRTTAAKKALG
jgi:hypothetical protein